MKRRATSGGVRRWLVAAALLASAATGARAEEGLPKESGVVMEVRLGTTFSVNNLFFLIGGLQGSLFGGYKVGRIVFGVGIDLFRVSQNIGSGADSRSQSATIVSFEPGVRVSLLSSSDQRVELYGEFGFGIGHQFSDQTPPPPNQPSNSNYLIQYQVGPGLRYWLHPSFAMGLLAALRGSFFSSTDTQGGTTQTSTLGVTNIGAQLQVIGVF